MLRLGEIDGFILDRYTFITLCSYIDSHLSTNHELADDVHYMETKTIQTEKNYGGRGLSFGLLVRDDEDYRYAMSS